MKEVDANTAATCKQIGPLSYSSITHIPGLKCRSHMAKNFNGTVLY